MLTVFSFILLIGFGFGGGYTYKERGCVNFKCPKIESKKDTQPVNSK